MNRRQYISKESNYVPNLMKKHQKPIQAQLATLGPALALLEKLRSVDMPEDDLHILNFDIIGPFLQRQTELKRKLDFWCDEKAVVAWLDSKGKVLT